MKHVRVSEILSRLFPYTDVDPIILEEKAKIGTNVHKAIVQDCASEFVVIESDRAQAYFDSYKMLKFAPDQPMLIRQVPRLYCDDLMITGECDGLLQGYGSDRLIDWKCSANAHQEQWNMQAHFYLYLLKVNGYSISEDMLWVNLRHRKRVKYGKNGQNKLIYDPLEPIVHTFQFDQKVLDKCMEAAIKYWEEKSSAISVV